MRRSALSLALFCLAAPAMPPGKGAFALDAMTTPGRHFGVGYYLSDRLSLRPSAREGLRASADQRLLLKAPRRPLLPGEGEVAPQAADLHRQASSRAVAEGRDRLLGPGLVFGLHLDPDSAAPRRDAERVPDDTRP